MKKIILSLVLLVSGLGFSQIKVIDRIPVIKLGHVGNNDIYIQNEGDNLTFFYKNTEAEDNSVKSFSFRDLNNDYESLHQIIVEGFTSDPLLDIKLELPNEYVWLHYSRKSLDRTYVQFLTSNKSYGSTGASKEFSLEQIEKLFSKKMPKKKTSETSSKDDSMSEFK
ncbi:hypothetical protein [Flavobacterium okayamense]|uniref:Uncharacterized protein n=1 Tax=Flavobacterium okayamense TaxID=2830782 RepID=A0ABM7SDQ3_9FLAO|nr:hypothetical protein [Flavobacterium okayamense]BCY28896.1 hypothetical protein KK2020170_17640 [Flavobacterium okayamense]